MRSLFVAVAACLVLAAPARAQTDPALQAAPADGWAAQAGGTRGGAAALPAHIYSVSNRMQLLAAFTNGATAPKIVKVVGTIDMSEGRPYTSGADQRVRSQVLVPSNTTLIGAGPGAGFVNAWINIAGVSNVIVRNLKIVAPCDVDPVWDPNDGSAGNWNAAYDAISVTGADHVWIDRNTITDAPVTDDLLPIANGRRKQCHDGAIDITRGANYVTVSFNVVEKHDKVLLIGSSDTGTTAAADTGRLKVTVANNVFRDVVQRVPRVRFGQVHVFNNYHVGDKAAAVYDHSYSIGVGKSGQILSHANHFAIAGAAAGSCDAVVDTLSPDAVSFFKDSGSAVNGVALGACAVSAAATWTVPYAFTARPAVLVKAFTLAQAGAGRISTGISGSGDTGAAPGTQVPAAGAAGVHTDTRFSIAFDGAPVLGSSGTIRVWRSSDGALVDTLDISTAPSATDTQTALPRVNLEIDAVGAGALPDGRARWVWYRPVRIVGNTATIQLRNHKLAFGTGYHLTIDNGVLVGTINGTPFTGVGAGQWAFTTRAAPSSNTQLRVSASETGADFRTVQGALNWVMQRCSTSVATHGCNGVGTAKTVSVGAGRYPELMVLRNVANLNIVGDDREAVIVGDANFESLNSGSGGAAATPGTALTTSGRVPGHRVLGGGRSALLAEGADLLTLRNFTLANPHVRTSAYDNQAEAIYFNTGTTASAARMVAKQMNFLAEQDTLQLKGYVWIYQSLVAGNVDYIWGNVMAALFEQSEIRSVFDNSSNSPGYIVQARATAGDKGFVFLDSVLTAGPGVTQAYLARSGGTTSSTYVDNVAFVNTRMGSHILPVGWCVGTGTSRTGTSAGTCSSNPPPWAGTANGGATDAAGWREIGSQDLAGSPLDTSGRIASATVTLAGSPVVVALSRQLGSTAGLGTRAEVFFNSTAATGAPGGWNPTP
jgi:pectate lyase/pectin methylesterase-like acyl-CoA thioesterase